MLTYIIKDNLSGFFKIGKTKNIKSRFSTLSTSNLNLSISCLLPGDEEKFLHQLFTTKKVKKEWYCLSSKDLDEIEELKFEIIKQNIHE